MRAHRIVVAGKHPASDIWVDASGIGKMMGIVTPSSRRPEFDVPIPKARLWECADFHTCFSSGGITGEGPGRCMQAVPGYRVVVPRSNLPAAFALWFSHHSMPTCVNTFHFAITSGIFLADSCESCDYCSRGAYGMRTDKYFIGQTSTGTLNITH